MRWIDEEGHAWPVTGVTCQTCGLPLIVVTANQTKHPLCEYERNHS